MTVLVTKAAMAEIFGVRRQAVYNWIKRRATNDFPLPVKRQPVKRGERVVELWDLADVQLWRQHYQPRGGRPPGPQEPKNRGPRGRFT